MAKMIMSIDGIVIKEIVLSKARTTVGRRPYNDVVIDNLAVSGEHAVLLKEGADIFLEDLQSTNGSYVNGKAVKKQRLQDGDSIALGKCKLKYVAHAENSALEPASSAMGTPSFSPDSIPHTRPDPLHAAVPAAVIRVLSGAATGREVALSKVVTTIGKPGIAVAAITKRPHGFVLTHVEGTVMPTVNGNPIGSDAVQLHSGDTLELAGTRMQFAYV